ncbi:2-oxo-4-hydroxy-4-carboxy-5-ureidoimidazoline decarboxylase [Vibrio sp. Y2-5]|uniref:2-oxo-4-hydroxy-4-carboxy-5-ureidoimidazoline decarboxylase n=1 Tax=Vibrio TaxID=662 RepID=UPI00142D6F78|nr:MULTISPECIES: 2-oxo-4-hydroxy-4-carboxy-5-ureidoimidazoline decarboxylase [Vibrio]MBD0786637.1 2-oxo-4-hydroxy-4-carboxy-5-ureidoimidazoline decarboxylase [Vibrio sp. Y2-5]NIY93773.1 2-oxo-4-hydroxy-4-carboxy-5-ureidoimidazoline decarboxylase [Vibrio diazotrophicus]
MTAVPTSLELDDQALNKICTSQKWVSLVKAKMPFNGSSEFKNAAEEAFAELEEQDWLEAFSGHPMIGDISTLQKKYAQGKSLSEKEQGGVKNASDETLQQLLLLNQEYVEKFGFIFIVCATNKSADEMLSLLQERINRTRAQELHQASIEQQKISQIRMEAYL